MAIDDKLQKTIDAISEQLKSYVGQEGVNAAIAAIPVVGSSILSVINDLALRRFRERTIEMFQVMTDRFRQIGEDAINEQFFKREEFQTILFLALEQLRTTHIKEKIRILGRAVANSGLIEFSSEDRKELFIRMLRDISIDHIRVLRELQPPSESWRNARSDFWPIVDRPKAENLAILQMLAANGLVQEFFSADKHISGPRFGTEWTEAEAKGAIKEYLQAILERQFRISKLGIDFLKFIGDGSTN